MYELPEQGEIDTFEAFDEWFKSSGYDDEYVKMAEDIWLAAVEWERQR